MADSYRHYMEGILANGQRFPFVIVDSTGNLDRRKGRQPPWNSEFFHPNESRDHPMPGVPAIEVYGEQWRGRLNELAPFELMHYMPDVDPEWRRLKSELIATINNNPQERAAHERSYQLMRNEMGERRSYDRWMDLSRVDQHIGGYLNPLGEKGPEHDAWYPPEQRVILEKMRKRLPRIMPDMSKRRRMAQ